MRLIDADALKETLIDKVFVNLSDEFYGTMQALDEAPTINAVPKQHLVNWAHVTRCKDCIYWQDNNGYPVDGCKWKKDETPDPEDFCSWGDRKEGDDVEIHGRHL